MSIYIHIPFCKKKCSYCNFYSGITEEKTVLRYLDALIKEIKAWGGKICRPVDSLYIGGGTPSVLGDKIAILLNTAKESFCLADNCEITVEMNPEENPEIFLEAAKAGGANRISIGLQSALDNELSMLGRRHTAADAKKAVNVARKNGFQNISIDIMTGLPYQTDASLKTTLDFAVALNIEHISSYILKLEKKTALYKRNLPLPDSDIAAKQYLFVCEYLKNHGYNHYEISNFAKGDFYSRHNLKYWQLCDYIGIGPSAHSLLNGERFYYKPDLKAFLENPEIISDGKGGDYEEFIMLSLRLQGGLNFDKLNALYKITVPKDLFCFISKLEKEALAIFKNNTLRLTDKGMLLSNTIITEILERIV